MTVQLKNIAQQVKSFVETMTFNGLNLITEENIRQIEFFLQTSSQVEAYRVATSLRYLHIELKRFLEHSPAFNIDRYVFFLSNCWLLSRAFLSSEIKKERDEEFLNTIRGTLSKPKILETIKLRLVGIEKIFLEGTIFGVILYFISPNVKLDPTIYKWSIIQTPKGIINPEVLLSLEIPNNKFTIMNLIYRSFYAEDISYSEKEGLIQLIKDESLIKDPVEEPFPIDILKFYHFTAKKLYKQISKHEFTPFDIPTYFLNYLLVKDVQIINSYRKEEDDNNGKNASIIFEITHNQNYSLVINLQDKTVNQALIDNLQELKKKEKIIKALFGKLFLHRGKLSVFPLSIYINGREEFLSLSEDSIDYRQVLKSLYDKDLPS